MDKRIPPPPTLPVPTFPSRHPQQRSLERAKKHKVIRPALRPCLAIERRFRAPDAPAQPQAELRRFRPEQAFPHRPRPKRAAHERGGGVVELVRFVAVDGAGGRVLAHGRLAAEGPGFDAWVHEVRAPRRAVAGHEEADGHGGVCEGDVRDVRGLGEVVGFVLVAEVSEDGKGGALVVLGREGCDEDVCDQEGGEEEALEDRGGGVASWGGWRDAGEEEGGEGGGGEGVQGWEKGVDEADFFVGDEGEDEWDCKGNSGELVADEKGKAGRQTVGGSGGGEDGEVEICYGKGKEGGEEEGVALGEIVVPVVPAVEDC